MRITGDTLEPSLGSNITVPNGMGINVSSTEVLEIGTTGIISQQPYACFVDEKSAGTEGGTFTSGDWRTRVLNTTRGINSITGSSLNTSTNQFILPTGTYRLFASCPAYLVELHQSKLRNITDSSDTLIGTSEYCASSIQVSNRSFINGTFTITTQKTFEIQHRNNSTQNSNGFGRGYANFGNVQVYTVVELWKLGH